MGAQAPRAPPGVADVEKDSVALLGTYDVRLDDDDLSEKAAVTGGNWLSSSLSRVCCEACSFLAELLLSEKQEAMDHLEPRRLWLWV